MDKFEKSLEKYEISDSLLTYRIYRRNSQIYVVVHTKNENNVVSFKYLLEDKRFLIDEIGIIDENG